MNTKNKLKEVKVKAKHFDLINDGIKPFLFLRKTTIEKQESFYIVNDANDAKILVVADNVLLHDAHTFQATFAGISKTFSSLLKNEKTKNKMEKYFDPTRYEKALHKMNVDKKRIKEGKQPIYGHKVQEEYFKAARADKWLSDIGYSTRSPQPILISIIKKEN